MVQGCHEYPLHMDDSDEKPEDSNEQLPERVKLIFTLYTYFFLQPSDFTGSTAERYFPASTGKLF